MRKQDLIFLGKTSEFSLQYSAQDLLIDENLRNEYLKEYDKVSYFWSFICYKTTYGGL